MNRNIRALGVVIMVLFAAMVIQLANLQVVQANKLNHDPGNTRQAVADFSQPRGDILTSDGVVLAQSVPSPAGSSAEGYPYDYLREYPQKSLYSDITGYDSILDFGKTDVEAEYDSYLGLHTESPQTLSQLLFREKPPSTTDNVTLTVEPKLQQAAEEALASISGKNKDGAIVVLNPKTGAVLARAHCSTDARGAVVALSFLPLGDKNVTFADRL